MDILAVKINSRSLSDTTETWDSLDTRTDHSVISGRMRFGLTQPASCLYQSIRTHQGHYQAEWKGYTATRFTRLGSLAVIMKPPACRPQTRISRCCLLPGRDFDSCSRVVYSSYYIDPPRGIETILIYVLSLCRIPNKSAAGFYPVIDYTRSLELRESS